MSARDEDATTPKGKTKKSKKVDAPKPIEGGAFIKHVLKKGGKNNTPLLIADLQEDALKERLRLLLEELEEYKKRCARYKADNAWYREEIETSQRDTIEYIAYLNSKKDEKLDVINKLNAINRADVEFFKSKKEQLELENQQKLDEIQSQINNLEDQLRAKEEEFHHLSDTITKREKHNEKLKSVRDEILNSEHLHQERIHELEKSLLDQRMKMQIESEETIKKMEAAAEQKATKYLSDHAKQLEIENAVLEKELSEVTLKTQRLIMRKEQLENENRELEREKQLRLDLITQRMNRVKIAIRNEKMEREEKRRKQVEKRAEMMERLVNSRGGVEECIVAARWDDLDSDFGSY